VLTKKSFSYVLRRTFEVTTVKYYITDLLEVEVVLVDLDCMPGAVLALVLVVVDDLLMPAGLVMVVVLVVVWAAGACDTLVVVVFDELLLIDVAAGVVWALATKLLATTRAAKKPERRFIE
jgi:hypothetical protein